MSTGDLSGSETPYFGKRSRIAPFAGFEILLDGSDVRAILSGVSSCTVPIQFIESGFDSLSQLVLSAAASSSTFVHLDGVDLFANIGRELLEHCHSSVIVDERPQIFVPNSWVPGRSIVAHISSQRWLSQTYEASDIQYVS